MKLKNHSKEHSVQTYSQYAPNGHYFEPSFIKIKAAKDQLNNDKSSNMTSWVSS